MSSAKSVLVIGGLSIDEIHLMNSAPAPGGIAVADRRHQELGGRGGNIAIAAYRGSHIRPKTEDGLVDPDASTTGDHHNHPGDTDECVQVGVIGAVVNRDYKKKFQNRMRVNGVNGNRIEILERLDDSRHLEDDAPMEQDFMTCFMDAREGQTMQSVGFGASNQWSMEQFDDIEKICPGEPKPDLVVVTQELKKQVVEQIIDTVNHAGIDLMVYACPGETLSLSHYPKITHLICNQSDAKNMLAREVNVNTWADTCEDFRKKGIQNVIIKASHLGAYFKNESTEGYSSGHKEVRDIIDMTGATACFAGTYAIEYIKTKHNWDIQAAVERANKASALVASDIGFESALPWADEIDNLQLDPLYKDMDELKAGPQKKKVFKWKPRHPAKEPSRESKDIPGEYKKSAFEQKKPSGEQKR